MQDSFFDLETPDGAMPTFATRPDGPGPHPVIVFLMDAPGMREELRDMCRRIGTTGYHVIAPQLYYRSVREFNVFENEDRPQMETLMDSLSNSMVDADVGVCLEHLAADPTADTSRVGTIGYCMSGPFAITAAAAHRDRVKAAISVHGVRLVTERDDSPHRALADLDAEVYVACAEVDRWAPPEMIEAFDQAMITNHTAGRVEWYPGTEHGFAFQERPAYVKEASERHWERIHELFDRRVRS